MHFLDGVKPPRHFTLVITAAIIALLAWMWWGLARLLSDGWIDQQILHMRYGGRPLGHATTPPVKDWSTLRVVLWRQCQGECAPYHVEVHGDGSVIFEGDVGVATPGRHVARLDPAQVRNLFGAFQRLNFFWLRPAYRDTAYVGDLAHRPPTYTLSLSYDGKSKTVQEFNGQALGMPAAVQALEAAVHRQTDVARWVTGDRATIPSLLAEGVPLSGDNPVAGSLLVGAARAHNLPLLQGLIAAGAPVKGDYGCQALSVAAFGRPYKATFDLLFKAGAPTKSDHCKVPTEWPGV